MAGADAKSKRAHMPCKHAKEHAFQCARTVCQPVSPIWAVTHVFNVYTPTSLLRDINQVLQSNMHVFQFGNATWQPMFARVAKRCKRCHCVHLEICYAHRPTSEIGRSIHKTIRKHFQQLVESKERPEVNPLANLNPHLTAFTVTLTDTQCRALLDAIHDASVRVILQPTIQLASIGLVADAALAIVPPLLSAVFDNQPYHDVQPLPTQPTTSDGSTWPIPLRHTALGAAAGALVGAMVHLLQYRLNWHAYDMSLEVWPRLCAS